MVLETPIDRPGPNGKTFEDKQVWADEIKLLESLIGMDPETTEFKDKEAFVTQAYKDQMAELRRAEEEERQREGASITTTYDLLS